jgi:hypothetical protein
MSRKTLYLHSCWSGKYTTNVTHWEMWARNFVSGEIWGYHCGLTEGSCILECDAMSLGDWLPTFRRILSSSSGIRLCKTCWDLQWSITVFRFAANHSPNDTVSHLKRLNTHKFAIFFESIACSSLPFSHFWQRCLLFHSLGPMATATVSCCYSLKLELNSCGLVNYASRFDKCVDYVDSRTAVKWKSLKGAAFPRVFGEQFDNFPHCWSSLPRLYWLRNNRCKELGCLREILSKIPFALPYD